MGIDPLGHECIEGHGHEARSHATSPVDTSSAPGTLDAHDPHMSPPTRGEKNDSMGSPHSTQAEKSGR